MTAKLILGPMDKGLKQNPLAFYIDDDAFPQLINAYTWRGRVKRKRGTSLLGRLNRTITSAASTPVMTLNGSGDGSANLVSVFSLESNSSIEAGSIALTDGTNTYTDASGVITGAPGGSGTINYATGAISITGGAIGAGVTGTFDYNPNLPVMGLESLNIDATPFPGTLAFDTTYSYNINTAAPYNIYDVSFYKNPASDPSIGYVAKSAQTPVTWNGENYQQFWTVNYQGALWASNGIDEPFTGSNNGMQFKDISGVAITTAGNGTTIPAVATLTIVAHGLVQGDFIFINEVSGITGINFQTGYVTSADPQAANTVSVTFPTAILAGAYTSGGIAQYLTNTADDTVDPIRWYDGDPTINSGVNGWVNFSPPLFSGDTTYQIADLPLAQYYLVGAKLVINFRDRLLFLGPVVQTSSGDPIYAPSTVIYSQTGTPYYNSTFNGNIVAVTTQQFTVLAPDNQTAVPFAWFEDVNGLGGAISTGYASAISSVNSNEDILLIGLTNRQLKLISTGVENDPFTFYLTNQELGTGSAFSVINMDRGVISTGQHGIIITDQDNATRIDQDIPDQIFQFRLTDNGLERVTAQRDFVNEWIYFSYPDNEFQSEYPNKTLQYNYRDNSWAEFHESYTTYGQFRKFTGYTWASIGSIYPTWSSWNDPWNAGSSTLLQPEVIAGNSQGFVLVRGEGTYEATSLFIQDLVGNVVTSPGHSLQSGDYITISGCLGTVGAEVNGNIYAVDYVDDDSFELDPPITGGTYTGNGVITRMYVPFIQSKQFNPSWNDARKTRIGVQRYLLTKTSIAQVTLYIYLSQDLFDVYNKGPIIPDPESINNGLVYSTILYTCPESTNLGLTPANTNLQMVTANSPSQQQQIWHRINTSLIGDTVQFAITLDDLQMRDEDFTYQFAEIELHGAIIDLSPSQQLA